MASRPCRNRRRNRREHADRKKQAVPVSGLHKTCNPCRQATAYRCPHFDRVDRQAMTITATVRQSDPQIQHSQLDNWAADLRHRLPTAERFSATDVTEYWIGTAASVGLDVGSPDHFRPLLGFIHDQLAEIGGRAGQRGAPHADESRLESW